MEQDTLGPGLLRIFGLYFVARLGVLLASGAVFFIVYRQPLTPQLVPSVILFVGDLLVLLILLPWRWLRRVWGRAYLPLVLAASSVIPIVEARYLYGIFGGTPSAHLWLIFPFLSVPLIVIAWQYELQQVLFYCFGTALFELLVRLREGPGAIDTFSQLQIILARTVFFILIGATMSQLVAAQRRQRRELAEANRTLVRYAATLEQLAISRERNRLARELHDTLAHTLSGLAVQLEAVETLWQQNPAKARTILQRALSGTRAGLNETRRALQDLRATPLEDLGLALALCSLAESVAARNSLALEVDVKEPEGELPPEVEQCYYRVAQEALENVARHAGARQVTISLHQQGAALVLEVADDGIGFAGEPPAAALQFGLKGMRERAALIGAELEVEGRPDQGTVVRLRKGEPA